MGASISPMSQYMRKDFIVLPDGQGRMVVGVSIFPFDVTCNLLAKSVWKRLGSPTIQTEHIGYLTSLDGEIEVQKKTTLTVKFANTDPMTLDFGIYDDDQKTGFCAQAVLARGVLRGIDPLSFPVHSQAVILDDNDFDDEICWVCRELIEEEKDYILHCHGDPKPAHLSCFQKTQSEPPEGSIVFSLNLCGCCRCPVSGLFRKANIPNRVNLVVSHTWPKAKILSYQTEMGSGSFQVKMLNEVISSVALETETEQNQARGLKKQADVLALFQETVTKGHPGTDLLPRYLDRGSMLGQEGRIYYLLTSLVSVVSSAGQLDRVRGVLTLHRNETPQDGMFGFLPAAYHLKSCLACDASPKWSTFLRQWISSTQKRFHLKRYKDRVSTFVTHLDDLIEKLIEPLEAGPEGIRAGLTLAPFDVDACSPGALDVIPLWGHWEFQFATVLHRCFAEVSEYLSAQTDDLFESRNQLYTLILMFHFHRGRIFESDLKMATDLRAKHEDSTI